MPKMAQAKDEWSAQAEYAYYRRADKMSAQHLEHAPIIRLRDKGYPDERLQFSLFWPQGPEQATREKVVLDLASGESFVGCSISELLPVSGVICMDPIVPQIYQTSQVWRRYRFTDNVLFVVGDAYNLPLADASVDIVIVSRALHHLPQFYRVLFEMDRVLSPSGSIIIVEPNDHHTLRRRSRSRSSRSSDFPVRDLARGIRKRGSHRD
jgi:SAM-dependent methyltransferase